MPIMDAASAARLALAAHVFATQEGARCRDCGEVACVCAEIAASLYDDACGAYEAEMAYERHLEDRGWMDSFREEDEARRGW